MNLASLEQILKNEPTFRLKQAKEAVFRNLIGDWNEATNLPPELREKLNQEAPLAIDAKIFDSKDGAQKALITLKDGQKIETVLMRHKDGRNTICVSSQIGCPLGCAFCATGKIGFKRNLTADEIVEQVLFFARRMKKKDIPPFVKGELRGILKNKSSPALLLQRRELEHVSNVVFMGMGEPFLNYDEMIAAIKILNDKNGLNISSRHISISTSGIIEGIKKLSDEPLQLNLALSLHAPDDKLRQQIMPIAEKYQIAEIFEALDDYIKKTKRRVMLEYIMINVFNDSDGCAAKLAGLIKKMRRPLIFVNLILYNETGVFRPSAQKRVESFKKVLEKEGIAVTQRWRFGEDQAAACGQLVAK